jgi:hypothetical protein
MPEPLHPPLLRRAGSARLRPVRPMPAAVMQNAVVSPAVSGYPPAPWNRKRAFPLFAAR